MFTKKIKAFACFLFLIVLFPTKSFSEIFSSSMDIVVRVDDELRVHFVGRMGSDQVYYEKLERGKMNEIRIPFKVHASSDFKISFSVKNASFLDENSGLGLPYLMSVECQNGELHKESFSSSSLDPNVNFVMGDSKVFGGGDYSIEIIFKLFPTWGDRSGEYIETFRINCIGI